MPPALQFICTCTAIILLIKPFVYDVVVIAVAIMAVRSLMLSLFQMPNFSGTRLNSNLRQPKLTKVQYTC